jgi:hypothetical protein
VTVLVAVIGFRIKRIQLLNYRGYREMPDFKGKNGLELSPSHFSRNILREYFGDYLCDFPDDLTFFTSEVNPLLDRKVSFLKSLDFGILF